MFSCLPLSDSCQLYKPKVEAYWSDSLPFSDRQAGNPLVSDIQPLESLVSRFLLPAFARRRVRQPIGRKLCETVKACLSGKKAARQCFGPSCRKALWGVRRCLSVGSRVACRSVSCSLHGCLWLPTGAVGAVSDERCTRQRS